MSKLDFNKVTFEPHNNQVCKVTAEDSTGAVGMVYLENEACKEFLTSALYQSELRRMFG